MRIRLSDIPDEGKSYIYTRETRELNAILSDLIGDKSHKAEFFIRPINGRDYHLNGTIKTGLDEQCSRCGIDFDFKIDNSFQEILIPHQPEDRTGRYARVNHVSDLNEGNGPGVVEYGSDLNFDIGEYLHEQIAISVPFNPAPAEDKNGDCSLCHIKVRGKSFGYHEEIAQEKPQKPFDVLKNLKV